MMTPREKANWLFGAAGVAAWVGFFPIWPLSALVVLAGGITLGFLSPRKSVLLLLLSPLVIVPSFSLGRGTWGYLSGDGTIRGFGLPGAEYHNLDREYRCYHVSSGCVIDGSEFLTHTPNNLAIEVLTSLFGPMRGAYAGPYPTREEALRAVQASTLQFLPADYSRQAAAFGVPTARGVEDLERELTRTLGADLLVSAALFQGETLVVGREKCLYLVDRRTGKRYARYFYNCSVWQLMAHGQYDQAIEELDHALEVDPRNADYLKERGDVYLQKGAREKALADYRKALEIAPPTWWERRTVEAELARLQSAGR